MLISSLLQIAPLSTASGQWSSSNLITNNGIIHFSPSAAQDGSGIVYLFWDQNPGINYIVTNTANIANNIWPSPNLYTKNAQSDSHPTVVALKNGTLVLFYASLRAGRWDIYVSRYNGGLWSPEAQLTNTAAPDQSPSALQDSTGKLWVAWTRSESGDLKIRFVDSNSTGAWEPGETIVYDTNSNGLYDSGEPVISGTAPANGTPLVIDPRLKFIDANGNGAWTTGEFVVYDPNLDAIYNPKLKFVDTNGNNVWDQGETIAYDANSDGNYTTHTGVTRCTGQTSPLQDCLIVGSLPTNNTGVKTDPHIKFLDLDNDGIWLPGDSLVYDTNNNGRFDTGEPVIAGLVSDPKLKFVGPGTTWASGNSVVYDSNNNGVYDSKIKFCDINSSGHWTLGDPVVYDNNLNGIYDYNDTPIVDPDYPSHIPCSLKTDIHVKFADSNSNGVWDPGEAVTYDSNLNNVYDGYLKYINATNSPSETWNPGKTVIYDTDNNGIYTSGRYHNDSIVLGTPPANNTRVRIDPKIGFFDKNGNAIYDQGETVVYDSNNNNLYDVSDIVITGVAPPSGIGLTTGTGETVVSPGSPSVGSSVKIDPHVKYVETDGNSVWDPGENIVYDVNSTGVYALGDPLVYNNGSPPTTGTSLVTDPRIRYSDSNGNNVWDSAEAVIYDANQNGQLDTAEYLIRGTVPKSGSGLTISGEPVISGPTPAIQTSLKSDSMIKFVDQTGTGTWKGAGLLNGTFTGEPVEYDANNNGVFDTGDISIAGSPVPTQGSSLMTDEMTLYGVTASSNTTLSFDSKVRYVDSNNDHQWNNGETVVYDANGNGMYDTGEIIISGTAPAPNTILSSDLKLKYFESNGNTVWNNGETVIYDANNSGLYDSGDTVVTVFPAPAANANLASDSNIKYIDFNSNGRWDPGEPVVYTNKSVYGLGNWTIAGTPPKLGAAVVSDSHLKFVNSNGGSPAAWNLGEQVVYDANGNGKFDPGELVVSSGPPAGGTGMFTVTHIFYKIYSGSSWGIEKRLTTLPHSDGLPSITQTEDGKVWAVWSGERGGPNEILYSTTTDGNTWTPESVLASSSLGDTEPSIQQDRNGTIWIAWSRLFSCNCGNQVTVQNDLLSTYSTNNGATWSPTQNLTPTSSGPDEIWPNLVQLNDRKLYLFFSTLDLGQTPTCNLTYLNNLISAHSAKLSGLSSSSYNLRVGQVLIFKTNVTNNGDFNDTMIVTFKANSTSVGTNSTLIKTGQTIQIILKWTVTFHGTYFISASVSDPGESSANQIDNSSSLGPTVLLRPAGDANGDCVVNVIDLVTVSSVFGQPASPGSIADLNGDGIISIEDLSIVGNSFGQIC